MNIKKFLPLIAAGGLGLVALLVAHGGFGKSSGDKNAKTVHVIVAKENIGPGQQLSVDNVSDQALSQADVPAGAFTSINDVMNRVTVAPMVAGQPVLQAFLSAPGALPGLPALIPAGMRAITIDVNETTGVAGLVQPGSHVDLLSVLNQGEHQNSCSRTIASNVPVVAVGGRMGSAKAEGDNGAYRTVTLLCKPKEAELIKLACLSANTSLMLRGNGDNGPPDSKGVMYTELTSGMPMTSRMPEQVGFPGGQPPVIPVSGGPTTHPAADQQQVAMTRTRQVTMINNGVISTVSLEVPNTENSGSLDDDDYTGVEKGPDRH